MSISVTNGLNIVVLPHISDQNQAHVADALVEKSILSYQFDEGFSAICWDFRLKQQCFVKMPGNDPQKAYSFFIDLSKPPGMHTVNNISAKPGLESQATIYFKRPDQTASYVSDISGHAKGIWILLKENYLRALLQERTTPESVDFILNHYSGYLSVTKALSETLKSLETGDAGRFGLANTFCFQGKIYNILSELLSLLIPNENRNIDEPEAKELIALNEFIKSDDCPQIPSIEAAARQLHVSVTKFKQLQKKVYLVPFLKYHQEQRLNKAKNMLLERQAQIKDVAYSLGFQSGSHFARSFRQRFGVPPSDYQRMYATN